MTKLNKGFTATELLIAVALIGGVTITFMSFSSAQFDLATKLNKKGSLYTDIFIFSKNLENPETCASLFGGLDLNSNSATYNGDFTYTTSSGQKTKTVLGDTKYSLTTKLIRNPQQESYGELRIEAKENTTGTLQYINIPLYLESSASGLLTRCSTRPQSNYSKGGCI